MVEFVRIPFAVLVVFYGLMGILLVRLSMQYKKNHVALLIILLFSTGVVSALGKNVVNAHKIITLVFSIYLLTKNSIFVRLNTRLNWFIGCFVLFVLSFLYSSLSVNNDDTLLTFAQLNRYLIPFILYFVIRKNYFRDSNSLTILNRLFFQLFVLQILFAIIQYVIIGQIEQICGMFTGGAVGTSIPLMGLLWLGLNTNLSKIENKHWIFMVGLLLSGFVAGKRAVWIMFPLVFLGYGLYVAKQKYPKKYMKLLFLAPVFLFFGLKLTPTLNPDHKVWGSFDLEYAYNYITDYSLGKEDKTGDRGVGSGRVGANKLLWQKITSEEEFSDNFLFGYGSLRVYAADKKYYRDKDFNFGVDSKGSLTGVFQLYIAFGFIGMILFFGYYFVLFRQVQYTRLFFLFLLVAIYDFIFYAGTIAREPALSVLFVFYIVFANVQYDSKGKFIGENNIDFHWKRIFKK